MGAGWEWQRERRLLGAASVEWERECDGIGKE